MWRAASKAGATLSVDDPEPTEVDWKAAKEATIWGLSALGCSAKQTSSWLRIDCPFGSSGPDSPMFNATGNGAWQARWTSASCQLTLPVGPGLEAKLIAGLGQGLMLVLQWRQGMKRPAVLGYVNEALLPACATSFRSAYPEPTSFGNVEDCRLAKHKDCDALAKCLRGERSHLRTCPKGWLAQPVGGPCVLSCKSAADCGPGWKCQPGLTGASVCQLPN